MARQARAGATWLMAGTVSGKLGGFQFWRRTLGEAKYVLAPMVDQSELAWRILARRYGAELCYTPMLNAKLFVENATYRSRNFETCEGDRPLIVQFCGNDPEIVLQAARLVEGQCDAVDLNLGCPQNIAKKGHYGSFLQDEWDLIRAMVTMLDQNLSIPVTCKIRIFPDLARTLAYAKMLEEAGCQLLTVHGRTREQRGQNTGLADWSYIKAVKEAVKIPVFANGNILYHGDIKQCMDATGAEGVMTAEGHLHNPMIFRDQSAPIWEMVDEYLEISKKHKTPLSLVRGHLFKLYRPAIHLNQDLRNQIGTAHKSEELADICAEFNERLRSDAAAHAANPASCSTDSAVAHWICQPYVRALVDGFSEAPPKTCGYCSEQLAAKACQYDGCGTCCATKNSDCSAHRSTDDSSKRARIMVEPVPA